MIESWKLHEWRDIGRLVDSLWWGETDVSELQPLRASCSSPGDCDVDHGMMVSTGANSKLVYQSALAAASSVLFLAIRDVSGASGRWAKEMRI
jgi:hypothetical protein